MKWKIPLFEIYYDQSDLDAVSDIIKSKKFWAEGKIISEFESRLAEYFDVKYCSVFNSGTSAQTSIFHGYGIRKNDEVIIPSFTFISTANSVLHVNATPVFADIEMNKFGLNPNSVLEKITKNTKAIVPVHYGGNSCEIQALKDIADDHNILLIEDNAESFGAMVQNKKLGSFGQSSFLSFCQNKIITTGEGGAVLTDDKNLHNKMLLLRSHGRSTGNYFGTNEKPDYISVGYNYRMPSMNAALGLSQLNKVEKLIDMRQNVAKRYINELSKMKEITISKFIAGRNHVYQLFNILLDSNEMRDNLMNYLKSEGIFCKIYFDPIHKTELYNNRLGYKIELPNTEDVSGRILNIPIFPHMKVENVKLVTDKISNFFNN